MKYVTSQLLDGLYAQTEANINKAVSEWQMIPDIQMITQPGPAQWSAAQCLEHLNSYGRYYLKEIEKAINKNEKSKSSTSFKSGWLGNYFYKIMLPQHNGIPKKKMNSPKNHQPEIQIDAAVVLNEFISQLEILGRLLTRARNIDIAHVRVPISIAPFIKLKLGDTFLFLIAHINRHMKQAERALQNSVTETTILSSDKNKQQVKIFLL